MLADGSTATSRCMVYMQAADFTRTSCGELIKSFAIEGTQHPCMRVCMLGQGRQCPRQSACKSVYM